MFLRCLRHLGELSTLTGKYGTGHTGPHGKAKFLPKPFFNARWVAGVTHGYGFEVLSDSVIQFDNRRAKCVQRYKQKKEKSQKAA